MNFIRVPINRPRSSSPRTTNQVNQASNNYSLSNDTVTPKTSYNIHTSDDEECWTEIRKLEPMGVTILKDKFQLNTSSSAVNHVLVFDPSIVKTSSSEWHIKLGSFLNKILMNGSNNERFFVCSINDFKSKINQKTGVLSNGENACILKFEKSDWMDENGKIIALHQQTEKKNLTALDDHNVVERFAFLSSNSAPMSGNKLDPQASVPLNVILFGETGVGKSSYINTLANLLVFKSFEQAQQGVPECLIPCSFTMTDANFNTVKIETGGQSEKLNPGASVTSEPMSYAFDTVVNGVKRKLNIIDTPGVGDTRGIEMDKENIRKVVEYLNQFDGLNAICILLHPNASRLTLQFKYCLNELFVNLTRKAAPNICFCYTNSRGTFFRPGECHPVILQELEKIKLMDKVSIPVTDNFFCFDSEVFRYLAAKRKNIAFDPEEVVALKSSWNKCNENLDRLIAYVANLTQTSVKPIFLLSTARQVLMELSKPVAETSRNIQINKNLAQDKMKELEYLKNNPSVNVNDLYIEQVDLEPILLEMPKTVCGNESCTEVVNFNGVQRVNYKSNCHAPCYLDNVTVEVIAHPEIKNCHAFDLGRLDTCKECNHNWKEHLHVMSEYKEVLVQVIDKNIQSMIEQNDKNIDLIQAAIDSSEKLINQLETEQQLLIQASAKLAKYIKRNGIKYYNPDLEKYLDLLIREEEQKRQAGGSNDVVIEGLRKVRDNFLEEVNILNSNLQSGADEIATEDDIQTLMDQITSMNINGSNLANLLLLMRK